MEILFLILLVALMATALGSGYPVAFALPGSAILTIAIASGAGWLFAGSPDAYFAIDGPTQWLNAGVTNLRGVYWEVERDTLIAIPLFIFMGIMLQRSKIAEDLLVTMAQLFGPVPGGLGISVVFVGALLAATTGIVGATVVAMGLISLPAMLRNNYSKPLATGTIAASGTLGQIIPPSIVLIILADQLSSAVDQASTTRKALYKATTGEISMPSQFDVSSTSAGEMFLGAFVPGLVLVGLYMLFILVFALLRPNLAPAVRYEGERDAKFWGRVLLILVPPLALIFLVLGSIIAGIATVNQAGAIGAAGALIMAGYRLHEGRSGAYVPALMAIGSLIAIGFLSSNYDLNIKAVETAADSFGITLATIAVAVLLTSLIWSGIRVMRVENTLQEVMTDTAKTTSLVFIILLGAAVLTASFRAFGGEELVRNFLETLPGGFWSQFIIVMAVIFVLGFFLDFIEIAVVVVPIVSPILLADPAANVTAVWLGVMIGLNIQTSFLTPPFGFALFYLRGVAPASVKTTEMYRGVVAFIALQLIALGIVGNFPPLVNYLPKRVNLTAVTAPPPRNPALQLCLEDYVLGRIESDGDAIRAAIATARGLDLSYLPEKTAKALASGFDKAEEALALLPEAYAAGEKVAEAAKTYRPVQIAVRAIERDVRRLEKRIKTLETRGKRLHSADAATKAKIEARIAELSAQRDALAAGVPADWPDTYKAFRALEQAEDKLRGQYRRAGDASVETALDLRATLADNAALAAIRPDVEEMLARVRAGEPDELIVPLADLRSRIGEVEGAGDARSAVSKARSALRSKTPDKEKAIAQMEKAVALLAEQTEWRVRAAAELAPGLGVYVDAITGSVGARQLDRMPRDMALAIAACESSHRDISLHF